MDKMVLFDGIMEWKGKNWFYLFVAAESFEVEVVVDGYYCFFMVIIIKLLL